jgi:uncharacterized membrane protein YkgB
VSQDAVMQNTAFFQQGLFFQDVVLGSRRNFVFRSATARSPPADELTTAERIERKMLDTWESNMLARLNQLIFLASRTIPFRSNLDLHLVRGAMVFTFFVFSIQKWNQYTVEMLVPMISHSPVVFWLLPAFGLRGAGYFLAMAEAIFGTLIFLGYWNPRLGILGALGSIVTYIGTTSIIPFLPNAWAQEAGGFPIMTLPLGFLMKDFLLLAVSFYLLKQDLVRAALGTATGKAGVRVEPLIE